MESNIDALELIIPLAGNYGWEHDTTMPRDKYPGWHTARFDRELSQGTPTSLVVRAKGSTLILNYYSVYGHGVTVDLCNPDSIRLVKNYLIGNKYHRMVRLAGQFSLGVATASTILVLIHFITRILFGWLS